MNKDNALYCGYILLSLSLVLLFDILLPDNVIISSLYIIPIFIAAYRFKTKEIALVSLVVILFYSFIAPVVESFSFINILLHDIGMILFTFLAIQFSIQRQRMDATLQHVQLFVQMITHDISQPITLIKLYLQLIKKSYDASVTEPVARISDTVEYLQKLITDMKDLAQASSGKFSIQPERMDLSKLLITIVEEQQKITNKHLLMLDVPPSLYGRWDKERLTQVFNNLISNAIKYSTKGKIIISAQKKRKFFQFSVKDEGVGITKNQLPYIFNPYVRLQSKRNVGGSGLGLYISKMLIEQHRGNMWVKSTKGEGSTFYFTLPIS